MMTFTVVLSTSKCENTTRKRESGERERVGEKVKIDKLWVRKLSRVLKPESTIRRPCLKVLRWECHGPPPPVANESPGRWVGDDGGGKKGGGGGGGRYEGGEGRGGSEMSVWGKGGGGTEVCLLEIRLCALVEVQRKNAEGWVKVV